MATGAWFDPAAPGVPERLCVHGNPNVLTAGYRHLAPGPGPFGAILPGARSSAGTAELPPVTVHAPAAGRQSRPVIASPLPLVAAGGPAFAAARRQHAAGLRAATCGPLALPLKQDDTVSPAATARDVLMRWGDRVTFDAPPWDSAHARRRRRPPRSSAGMRGSPAIAVPPAGAGWRAARRPGRGASARSRRRWPSPAGGDRPPSPAAMQGASLRQPREARRPLAGGGWRLPEPAARRRHAVPLVRAGSATAAVRGGCSGLAGGCVTPWGTLLLAEGDPRPGWRGSRARSALRRGRRLRLGGGARPARPAVRAGEAHRAGPLRRMAHRGRDAGPRRARGGLPDRSAGRRLPLPLRLRRAGDRGGCAGRGSLVRGARWRATGCTGVPLPAGCRASTRPARRSAAGRRRASTRPRASGFDRAGPAPAARLPRQARRGRRARWMR